MDVNIISPYIIHKVLCSRSLKKRNAGSSLVGPQEDVQNGPTTNDINDVFVGCTVREIFDENGSLLTPSVLLLLTLGCRKILVFFLRLREKRAIVLAEARLPIVEPSFVLQIASFEIGFRWPSRFSGIFVTRIGWSGYLHGIVLRAVEKAPACVSIFVVGEGIALGLCD